MRVQHKLENKKQVVKMAKAKATSSGPTFHAKPKRKRPGVHSKKKNSVHKSGKNYNKKSRGQGTGR